MGTFESYMRRICKDTAVYWEYSGVDEFSVPQYELPREIKCRWVEEIHNIMSREGEEIVSMAMVYVLEDLVEQSMLHHGPLEDLSSEEKADPRNVDMAFEIKRFMKVPSLRSGYNRKLYL